MPANPHVMVLKQSLQYFSRTCSVFGEEDARYAPTPGQFSVAQHVAHVAQTIDWFIEGAFRPVGFDLDFAAHQAAIRKVGVPGRRLRLAGTVGRRGRGGSGTAQPGGHMAAPIAAGPDHGRRAARRRSSAPSLSTWPTTAGRCRCTRGCWATLRPCPTAKS